MARIQKHRGKPLLFHDKCPGFFYVHYTTHGTYSFTSHPKDEAIMVECLAQGHKAPRPVRLGFEPTFWQHQNLSPMHWTARPRHSSQTKKDTRFKSSKTFPISIQRPFKFVGIMFDLLSNIAYRDFVIALVFNTSEPNFTDMPKEFENNIIVINILDIINIYYNSIGDICYAGRKKGFKSGVSRKAKCVFGKTNCGDKYFFDLSLKPTNLVFKHVLIFLIYIWTLVTVVA